LINSDPVVPPSCSSSHVPPSSQTPRRARSPRLRARATNAVSRSSSRARRTSERTGRREDGKDH